MPLFVECPGPDTRQTCLSLPSVPALTLGKHDFFAECRVSHPGHSAKTGHSRPRFWPLCRVPSVTMTLGKDGHFRPRMHIFLPRGLFAECISHGTRQIALLPSVTLGKAATYNQFIWFDHSLVPYSNKHHIYHR